MENKFEIGDNIIITDDIASEGAIGIVEDIWQINYTFEYRVRIWWNGGIYIFNVFENQIGFIPQRNENIELKLTLLLHDQIIDSLREKIYTLTKENEDDIWVWIWNWKRL